MTNHPDPSFGKVLFQQKPNKGNVGNAVFLLILAVPMMCVFVAPDAPMEVRLGFFCFGSSVAGFVLIMLWRSWMRVFLQETGLREYRQGRGRSLAYAQVEEMQYSSIRVFNHGSYIHTGQKLALKSAGQPGRPLVCTLFFKEADGRSRGETKTSLTDVRDRISVLLANRLENRLERKTILEWSPKVCISTRGLHLTEYHDNRKFVEWRRVRTLDIEDAKLRVWIDQDQKPRIAINTTEPNFYPTLALALRLQSAARRITPPSSIW